MIINVTERDFKEKVLSSKKAIVDFWAPWCGPCRAFGPILEKFAENSPNIVVAKVNVDESPELAKMYKIQSIPSVVLFKDGVGTELVVGVQSLEALQKLANK